MKTYKIFTVLIIIALMILSVNISAKNKRVPKVYAFGYASSFNDSVVYFTNIQEIDSVWINDKNNFLIDRANYSYQLKNYLESTGLQHRTCIISYALKRKDIEKKYNKLRDKLVKKSGTEIKYIDKESFNFTTVELSE